MNDLKAMLIDKNLAYGDSALAPVRIFSRADPNEQLLVRLDDKLSRIAKGSLDSRSEGYEDAVRDIIGYLVLLLVSQRWPDDSHR
jgi:hypothetical protein